ncbi:MAG TPA: serine/threonine-protein kinase [Anaerolineales bacterium]|nr:serine/threonine-protein kinase [Anaerolineales bacterium]
MNGLIGRTVGRYRILNQIGQGGMSSVFRAVDLADGRAVAVKVLSPHIAHEEPFQARFEREILLLVQLQHPNIIPILDFGTADGVAFIVMPFMAHGTLHDRLKQGPLDPLQGGRIVDQLASALTLAHENGVVHRDVKPSNVLMDENDNALLSDFSFARPQDASQNLTGSALIGTPAYMSPEQCRGEPIDARSDQYSFGVLLFQITTGYLPFEGDTPMATALKHVNTPLPLPRQINPNLPEGIERILIRALAKDPALRFDSVAALNQAFQTALTEALDPHARAAGEKTLSRSATLAMYRKYQNVTPAARRRSYERPAVLVALLMILLCVLTVGAAGLLRPDLFFASRSAEPPAVDVEGTVQSRLALALAAGTLVPTDVLQTQVYGTVLAMVDETQMSASAASSTPSPEAVFSQTSPVVLAPLTSTPSSTLIPGGITPTATRTLVPTRTRTTAPTSATTAPAGPSTTPSATTAVPPTATPAPATSTSPPPTSTSPPTATLPPTDTSVPPADTEPAPVCEWHAGHPSTTGNTVSVRVTNDGGLPLHVTHVSITWTGSDHLRRIRWRFEGPFWSGNDPGPTVSSSTSKTVPLGTYRTVQFEFWGGSFSGTASVDVDGGC